MGSTSQQLSELGEGGSLSQYMVYLLLCDTIFWGLTTQFCAFIFRKHLCFFLHRVFSSLLSRLSPIFSLPKRIGLHKLLAKLSGYSTLCSFLRGQVVNCSQCS
jgi:hypothetical protein